MNFLKCGTGSLQSAAMVVAIIDTICTSILLILFVLGSSLMLAFQIMGKHNNATRVLDIVTDDVFGTVEQSYDHIRARKDEAEDMGVWLIVMFLTIVDFIISCIFLDGVRSKNERKCQTWFNMRIIIIVVFKIIVFINIFYGTSLLKSLPDLAFTLYRVFGITIGYYFLKEIQRGNKGKEEAGNAEKKGIEIGNIPKIHVEDSDDFPGRIPSASFPNKKGEANPGFVLKEISEI